MLKCGMFKTVIVFVFVSGIASVSGDPTIPNHRDNTSRYSPSGGQLMSSPSPWEIQEAMLYVNKLVKKYGADGVIPFEGLEHFMANLGLGNLAIKDHALEDHKTEEGFVDLHSSHDHGSDDDGHIYEHESHEHINHDSDDHDHHEPDDHKHHGSDEHSHQESQNQSHHESEDHDHREADNQQHDSHNYPEDDEDSHSRQPEDEDQPGRSRKARESRSLDPHHGHTGNQVHVRGNFSWVYILKSNFCRLLIQCM